MTLTTNSTDRKIRDIKITNQFIQDWETARRDPQVETYVDRLINVVTRYGELPNSLNPHKAFKSLPYIIGYVSVNRVGWRMTFLIEDGVMIFDRLLRHDEMDIYLREMGKI